MRDLLLTLIVFGTIPFILARPYVGILVWSWLGYMNPHRLFAWSFAYSFPFSMVVALATFTSLLFNRESKQIPLYTLTYIWLFFVAWMSLNTLFALVPDASFFEFKRTIKIQIMIFLTLMLINDRHKLNMLIWVIVASIGFYGIKGGIFTFATGGQYLIWGPEDSFIEGNNELALAMVMIVPLMRYLQLTLESKWLRWAMLGAIGLTSAAIISSYSRGAFLAISAMLVFLILKTRKKILFLVLVGMAVPFAIPMMPDKWFDRMETIQTYREDASAMGRLQAWNFAVNVAAERKIIGGGFQVYDKQLFYQYNTEPYILESHEVDPTDFHDAHSIYFEVLAEQGFGGLLLFLLIGFLSITSGLKIQKLTKNKPELTWAWDLSAMVQVSLVGYCVGGAFLGLAYFDLPYHLMSIILITRMLVEKELGIYRKKTNTFADNFKRKPSALQPAHAQSKFNNQTT